MKKTCLFLCILLSLFMIESCDFRMEGFEDVESIPDNVIIARIGQNIILSSDFSDAKWFSREDFEGNESTFIANGSQLNVSAFEEPGVRYYRCEDSDGSYKDYVVGCTGLPIIEINTYGQPIQSKITYLDCLMTIYNEDGTVAEENTSATVRGRGNSTWFKSLKKGYKLHFDTKRKLFGLSKSKSWPLIPNSYDYTLLGNWFAGYIRNEIFDKDWNPNYVFCDLVINGVYLGPYSVAEGIKISSSRIDIQSLDSLEQDVNQDGVIDINDGGFLLEISMKRDGEVPFTTSHGVCVALIEPEGNDIADICMRDIEYYIKDKMNRLEDSIYGTSKEKYSDFLDLESFVDWYLVNEFMDNSDAGLHMSTYMYYDPSDGKLHMGPCWDFDHYVSRNNDSLSVDVPRSLWVHELLKKDEVKDMVRNRWNEKKTDLFNAINNSYKEMAENKLQVAGYMNLYRWSQTPCYQELVDQKSNQLKERFDFIDSYLNGSSM